MQEGSEGYTYRILRFLVVNRVPVPVLRYIPGDFFRLRIYVVHLALLVLVVQHRELPGHLACDFVEPKEFLLGFPIIAVGGQSDAIFERVLFEVRARSQLLRREFLLPEIRL